MATSAEPVRLPHFENERRTACRKPLPAHSVIELQPGRGGAVRDLSEGGVSLFGCANLAIGSETRVHLSVADSDAQIEASGVVAWTDELATGIRFVHIDAESLANVQTWLEQSSAEDDDQIGNMRTDAVLAAKVACLREIADLQAQISSEDLDQDAALALIVRRLAELTRATGAAIALRDGQQVICRASYGNAPDIGVQLSQTSLSGECLRSANVVLLQDSETDPRVDAEICRQLNFRSLLIVPVLSNGKAAGIAEVLSPNPGNFEGGDILVVNFISDLIAGVAVPPEPSEAPAVQLRNNFEPLLEPDLPRPEIAFEVSNAAAPAAMPQPIAPTLEQTTIAPRETLSPPALEPVAARTAPMASSAATLAPTRAPAPPQIQETWESGLHTSVDADRQKRLLLAAVVIALLLITIGVFAIFRSRKSAPSPQQTVAPTTTAAAPATIAPTTTQPASAGVVEPQKTEQKKPSSSPAHTAKASAESHNGSPAQEVSIREVATTSAASDAPPDAPSVGQLSARSSAEIAAQVIAANTPAPELTPLQSRGVVEGKLIKKVLPRYPEMARRAGVGGDVNLIATIGTDGKLKNIKVMSGSPLLREEAIVAARQWRYSPYLLGGKPVETDTHITISFKH